MFKQQTFALKLLAKPLEQPKFMMRQYIKLSTSVSASVHQPIKNLGCSVSSLLCLPQKCRSNFFYRQHRGLGVGSISLLGLLFGFSDDLKRGFGDDRAVLLSLTQNAWLGQPAAASCRILSSLSMSRKACSLAFWFSARRCTRLKKMHHGKRLMRGGKEPIW